MDGVCFHPGSVSLPRVMANTTLSGWEIFTCDLRVNALCALMCVCSASRKVQAVID